MSIASSLQSVYSSKQAIKTALTNKGATPTDDLSTYAGLIDAISTGGAIKFTDGTYFYYNGARLTDLPIDTLDTSEMVNMNNMFSYCNMDNIFDLSTWDFSKVKKMTGLFNGANSPNGINFGSINTSSLTNIMDMFAYSGFTSLDLSNFDVSKVIDMQQVFYNCSSLSYLDLTGWNTSSVSTFGDMFYNCTSLQSIDVSSFNTQNAKYFTRMFSSTGVSSIDISSFDTSKASVFSSMFADNSSLTSVTGFSMDYIGSSTMYIDDIFSRCNNLANLTFKNGGTFGGRYSINSPKTLDLSNNSAMTKTSIINMINSCSPNISGVSPTYRKFRLEPSVYSLLTSDDIALFTAKNYTVGV